MRWVLLPHTCKTNITSQSRIQKSPAMASEETCWRWWCCWWFHGGAHLKKWVGAELDWKRKKKKDIMFSENERKKSLFWDVGKESMGFVVSPSVNWKWNQSVSCKPAYNVAIGCQNFTHNPILNFWRDPNIIINK